MDLKSSKGPVTIAMLGVDGAGKGTLIKMLSGHLKEKRGLNSLYRHLQPAVFPPFGKIVSWIRRERTNSDVRAPGTATPHGLFIATVKLCWLMLDYTAGLAILKQRCLRRGDNVIIFDRYFFDLMVDPKRFRVQRLGFLFNWLLKKLPRPDLVFVLHGDPKIVHARKRELRLETLLLTSNELLKIPNIHIINVDVDAETSLAEICRVIDAYKDFGFSSED